MKTSVSILMAFAIAILPGLALAQAKPTVAVEGNTDASGKVLPTGGTSMAVTSDGKTTTLTLRKLYTFGEAGLGKGETGVKKQMDLEQGTAYMLRANSRDWRGGRTAASVKLDDDKGTVVLSKAVIANDTVTFTFPSGKAKAGDPFDCKSTNFLFQSKSGNRADRAWLGHPNWAASNTAPNIGDYMVLAGDDARFPATALCYDANGKLVPLTPAMRAELAKIINKPEGADKATKVAADN